MSSSENTGSGHVAAVADMLPGIETSSEPMDAHKRQLAALLAFGRRANDRPPLPILMQDAGALVAEILEADLAGVGEVAADGANLVLKVASTDSQGHAVDPVVHTSSLAAAESMAGCVLDTASPIVTADLANEKRFTDRLLRKLEVASAMTVPLYLKHAPFGVLGVYCKQPREFTPDDVHFAETIAHLLTSSVGRVKAEEESQQQQMLSATTLELVNSLVLVLDARGNLVSMNRACQQTTGFSLEEIRDKPFSNVFVTPQEIDSFQAVLRKTVNGKSPHEFESDLVIKDGNRRRVSWSLKAMRDEAQAVRSVMLAGEDITDQLQGQQELQRAKKVSEEASRTLRELRERMANENRSGSRLRTVATSPPGEQSDGTSDTFQRGDGSRGIEKRSSVRREYHYRQAIAPMYGSAMPSPKDFLEVACEDISAGGMAFYLDGPPEFEYLVVALGRPPSLAHFSARVVRVEQKEVNGETTCLIGCRFTGRVHL